MKKGIETTTTINHETGEVTNSSVVRRYKGDEPNYVKLYLSDISYLYGFPSTNNDLLFELLKYISYGTNEIILNATTKKRMAEVIGMNVRTVDNKLQELVKTKILDRVAPGTFTLNPYLFGKGDWKSVTELRNKNLHLKITYDKETGKRIIKGSMEEVI
jgi:hypothetical protein